jgi:NAD(P)-dependent dehydrogenase (short-subunit alcohol dehydrogenase family)
MRNEMIEGDAQLGDDGVLQGWCWNAQRPAERLIVETLIDERIVCTNVASRFREDLRARKIGDGYYGFMATLARSLAAAGDRFVIAVRERSSGQYIWRHIRGAHALPDRLSHRIDALRQRLAFIAGSSAFRNLAKAPLAPGVAGELGGLGALLNAVGNGPQSCSPVARARKGILRRMVPVTIASSPHPKAAVIVVADSTCDGALAMLAALAPDIGALGISLVLIDRGRRPELALAPSLFANLEYVFDSDSDWRTLVAGALKRSRAEYFVFVHNPPSTLGRGLAEILPRMLDRGSLHVSAHGVGDIERICALSPAPLQSAHTAIGLRLAGGRQVLERFIGLPASPTIDGAA